MERYKNIIDDWEEFREACEEPKIPSVRKNQIKAGNGFEPRLKSEFSKVEQSEWNPNVYRLTGEEKPGNSLLHWRGEYYVQEESAAIPVEVLGPEKSENILDIAAAPGGKATQIASKIKNDGLVVANDASSKRMKSLHANVYRTGSACIAATNYDGRQIPGSERFDRILVDAPCSGEGDRARRKFEPARMKDIEGLAELQKKLLERASELVKKRGTIVYSTCTFAPEENEEVVKYVLENTGLELADIELDAPHQRGVTQFQEREYPEKMRETVRIYPHHLNSGGMYVAKFRK
jgi:NOL1/NOP2/sun family putative RNA methylase